MCRISPRRASSAHPFARHSHASAAVCTARCVLGVLPARRSDSTLRVSRWAQKSRSKMAPSIRRNCSLVNLLPGRNGAITPGFGRNVCSGRGPRSNGRRRRLAARPARRMYQPLNPVAPTAVSPGTQILMSTMSPAKEGSTRMELGEAHTLARQRKRVQKRDLLHYARLLRVENPMSPYLQAIE
jgi:hypothetical protein